MTPPRAAQEEPLADAARAAPRARLAVLHVGAYVLGHAAYQQSLERAFPLHAPEIDFRSLRLPDEARRDLPGRIAWRLLNARPFGTLATDADYLRLRQETAGSLFCRRLLARRLAASAPDVLHLHTQSIALLAAGALARVPTVVSLDCTSALLARLHPAPASRTYAPIVALERRCLAAAAHVVAWSQHARRSVIDDYGLPPGRVSVIRPAVRADFATSAPRHPGRRPLRLLFVGNDFVRKGGPELLDALADGLHPGCELDVVSNGPVPDGRPGVRVHRGVAPWSAALATLYATADVFVMPTREDAFGLVYLEAMAAGLPCIGTDVLAVPELLGAGERGLVVSPGDRAGLRTAIERLRDDPALRRRLGDAGRRFVAAECDERANCRALAAVYDRIAATAPARRSVP